MLHRSRWRWPRKAVVSHGRITHGRILSPPADLSQPPGMVSLVNQRDVRPSRVLCIRSGTNRRRLRPRGGWPLLFGPRGRTSLVSGGGTRSTRQSTTNRSTATRLRKSMNRTLRSLAAPCTKARAVFCATARPPSMLRVTRARQRPSSFRSPTSSLANRDRSEERLLPGRGASPALRDRPRGARQCSSMGLLAPRRCRTVRYGNQDCGTTRPRSILTTFTSDCCPWLSPPMHLRFSRSYIRGAGCGHSRFLFACPFYSFPPSDPP